MIDLQNIKIRKKQLHVPQERKMVRGDNIRLICKQQQLPCNLISLANVSHYGLLNARCRKCTECITSTHCLVTSCCERHIDDN